MTSPKQLGEMHDVCAGREPFVSAFKFGVVLQLLLLVVTACVLDGGQLFQQFAVGIIGYWLGVVFIVIRRERTPTKTDLFFIRYGSLVVLVLVPLFARLVYMMIGESTLNGLQRFF